MNSRKIPLVAFLLFLLAGISFNLAAQEKKVHIRIITNGKSSDSVYTISYTHGSKGVENQNAVIVRNTNQNVKSPESEDTIVELEVETPDIYVNRVGSKHPGVMIMRSGNYKGNLVLALSMVKAQLAGNLNFKQVYFGFIN